MGHQAIDPDAALGFAGFGARAESIGFAVGRKRGRGLARISPFCEQAVCDRVHRDEIRHVRLAAHWLRALSPGQSDLSAYLAAVPFPFAANRAKGRRFEASARREAGLSEAFIAHVQTARGRGQPA